MNAPALVLTPGEQATLKSLMRDALTYGELIAIIDRFASQSLEGIIYGPREDRDYKAGYAAALLHLREALSQAKLKVYSAP